VNIDGGRNETVSAADRLLSTSDASVGVAVVAAREDNEIARQVREVLGGDST
jgi:hypothetical protein